MFSAPFRFATKAMRETFPSEPLAAGCVADCADTALVGCFGLGTVALAKGLTNVLVGELVRILDVGVAPCAFIVLRLVSATIVKTVKLRTVVRKIIRFIAIPPHYYLKSFPI